MIIYSNSVIKFVSYVCIPPLTFELVVVPVWFSFLDELCIFSF